MHLSKLGTAVIGALLCFLFMMVELLDSTTVATTPLFVTGFSNAPAAPTGPVAQVPTDNTPHLNQTVAKQNVRQLVQCGDTMYAVGSISSIRQGTSTYSRNSAFSFSASTGQVSGWNPDINGIVSSVVLSPDCQTAYLGGSFTSVHGASVSNIAAVDTAAGAVDTSFAATANKAVSTLQYIRGEVIVGGQFTMIDGVRRSRMASLDPASGAPTSYLRLAIAGKYPRSSPTKVYNSQVSHQGDQLLIEGVFTSIAAQPRQQVAVLDLTGSAVTVNGWTAPQLDSQCMPVESYYAKAATWSPDDSVIYIATTGYKPNGGSTNDPRSGLCDAVSAFPSTPTSVSSNWINYTGCDSYYSVAADQSSVYVAGHERWADNSNGCDGMGPGAVSRSGLGAIDPLTGTATAWNPVRARGHGAEDMLLTTDGLWIASDNDIHGQAQACGGLKNHGGICFLPYPATD